MQAIILISIFLIVNLSYLVSQSITYDKYSMDANNDLIITNSGKEYLFGEINNIETSYLYSNIKKIVFRDSLVWISYLNQNQKIVTPVLKTKDIYKIVIGLYNTPEIKYSSKNDSNLICFLIADTAIYNRIYSNFKGSPSYIEYSRIIIPNEKIYALGCIILSISATGLLVTGYGILPLILLQPALFALESANINFTKQKIFNKYVEKHHLQLKLIAGKLSK